MSANVGDFAIVGNAVVIHNGAAVSATDAGQARVGSNGTLSLGTNANVGDGSEGGNVQSIADLTMGNGSRIHGNSGNASTNGNLSVGTNARIDGDASAGGDATLGNGAKVIGTLAVGGTATYGTNASTASESSSPIAVPVIDIPSTCAAETTGTAGSPPNLTTATNATTTVSPGDYDTYEFRNGNKVTFESGEYYFNSLSFGTNSKITVVAPVTINIGDAGQLHFGNGSDMTVAGTGHATDVVYKLGSSVAVSVGTNGHIAGTLCGAEADVTLNNGAHIEGAIYADNIEIGTNGKVFSSPANLSMVMLTLVDETGSPLANYPADYPGETRNLKDKYRCGGSWGPTTSFQTDAGGHFFVSIGCDNWDHKVTVTLDQTTREQDVTVNPIFQAAKVNANLETCDGPITDVPGGAVDQGGGYWYHHGNTGLSGTVSFYTFPGNIKLRMGYNHNTETLFPTISAGVNEVDFQTTAVTLDYPGDIKSNKGGSWWMFSKPSMDLLPGDYNFWFKTGSSWSGPVSINVSGCDLSQAFALLKVLDENGHGVAGGKATPAYGGSWGATLPGETDANGNLFAEIPPGYTKIRMTVNQGSVEQTTAELATSNYTWTTQVLRIWLEDHTGTPITDGAATLDQGGGYWYGWGNLNSSGYRDIQLFPGSYKFKVTYNYTSDTQYPVVGTGAGYDDFHFRTGQVFGACITQYSASGWQTFTDGIELMPGTYTFRSPSQSGTITAGGITNLLCPS